MSWSDWCSGWARAIPDGMFVVFCGGVEIAGALFHGGPVGERGGDRHGVLAERAAHHLRSLRRIVACEAKLSSRGIDVGEHLPSAGHLGVGFAQCFPINLERARPFSFRQRELVFRAVKLRQTRNVQCELLGRHVRRCLPLCASTRRSRGSARAGTSGFEPAHAQTAQRDRFHFFVLLAAANLQNFVPPVDAGSPVAGVTIHFGQPDQGSDLLPPRDGARGSIRGTAAELPRSFLPRAADRRGCFEGCFSIPYRMKGNQRFAEQTFRAGVIARGPVQVRQMSRLLQVWSLGANPRRRLPCALQPLFGFLHAAEAAICLPKVAADAPRWSGVREVSQLCSKKSSACSYRDSGRRPAPPRIPSSTPPQFRSALRRQAVANMPTKRDTYIASAIGVRMEIPPWAGDTSGSENFCAGKIRLLSTWLNQVGWRPPESRVRLRFRRGATGGMAVVAQVHYGIEFFQFSMTNRRDSEVRLERNT